MSFEEYRDDLRWRRDGRLPGPVNLIILERVDSTNLLARRIAEEYLNEGLVPPETVVATLEQTAGRGRQGRPWTSPPGVGVYTTWMRPGLDEAALRTLPLLVAVGVARVLGELVGGACRIKWPNDLVVADQKIGGVLIEAVSTGAGGSLALIGLGINRTLADDAVPGATALAREMASRPPSLGELTWSLLAGVERELAALGQMADAVERYRELSVHSPGEPMRCRIGDELVDGTFRGFDDNGFLRLEIGDGERTVSAGEVIER